MLNQLGRQLLKTTAIHILNNLEYSKMSVIQCLKGSKEKNAPL